MKKIISKANYYWPILLGLLVILGLGLRLWRLKELPVILNRDEAALAYNAWSLTQVGKDEWGRVRPVALESFGDFKLVGYPLWLIVSYQVFGVNDLAVRLPSVLAGTLIIGLIFYFAKTLGLKTWQALGASLFTTTIPVLFFYSRSAYEANVALMLMLTVIIGLFYHWPARWRLWTDFASIGLALLAVFTYNTPLLLLPFLIAVLPLIRGIKRYRAWLVPVLGLAIVVGLAAYVLLPLSSQKSNITIFNDETVRDRYAAYRQQFGGLTTQLIGNQYVYFGRMIWNNFFDSFSPRFLVTNGGRHPWHSLPGFGHLYWVVYLLGLIGLIIYLKRLASSLRAREVRFKDWLLPYLTIVSLVPSVITVDAPHATRSLLFFCCYLLLAVIGLTWLLNKLKRSKRLQQLLLGSLLLIFVLESLNYFYHYFNHYPQQQEIYKPGFDLVIQEVETSYPDQPVAIVDSGYQYILLAWYLKIPPQKYLENNIRQLPDRIGLRYGEQVVNYHFIAHRDDRRDPEKILIEWTGSDWQVTHF